MKIIATEEHFHSPGYLKVLRSRKQWPNRVPYEENGKQLEKEFFLPGEFRIMDPANPGRASDLGDGRISDMDEAGVSMQVLSLSFPSLELFDADEATAVAKVVNDEIAEVIKKYPGRFTSLATIAPQSPAFAVKELERAVTKLGLKGAMVTGHIAGVYLDDKKFWPVLEAASNLDVPIYIHPKFPPQEMIKPYLGYPGLSSAILGFAADASLHAMRLILSGVFDKYPNLKIVLGHMGEALPFWLWRMDSRIQEESRQNPVAAKYYKGFKKSPSQYFKDHFYVTTSGMFWHPALQFVSQVLGADRILFATDYPYESGKEAVEFLLTAPIPKADLEKIAHGNAERIFKLK
jgi:5-carboxyvanillate decarboxylase